MNCRGIWLILDPGRAQASLKQHPASTVAQRKSRRALRESEGASPLVIVEGDRPEGLFIDLTEKFAHELDWKVEYVRGTWSPLLEMLRKGEIDLLPAVGYTEARTKIYDFCSRPVFIDSGVVFTRRDTAIHTIFDLQGKSIAGLRDSTFTAAFAQFIASFDIKCDIILVEDNSAVMRKIADGEAFAGVCIYSLGSELARSFPVVITPISFSPIGLEFAVPKGRNSDLIAGIDRIMAGMFDDPLSPYSKSFEKWITGRQPVKLPLWLWVSVAVVLSLGLMLAVVAMILRHEVKKKTEYLRAEIEQRKESEERLTRSLHENETLLHELYHRTKNTLQLIRSFITLEALELQPSEDIDRLVRKTEDRINAISLVHGMLYRSRDLSRISIRKYVQDLMELLLAGTAPEEGKVAVDLVVDDLQLLLDTAIPLGLIINELVTNSIKHAFPEGRMGRISLGLAADGECRISLDYRDDGVGVPEGFDLRGQRTLGISLILKIAENQLKGEVSIERGPGLRYIIRIPTNLYEARV